MPNPPQAPSVDQYQRKYYGFFGKLGEYQTEVKYLQTSLNIKQLNHIRLVDSIPGSNEWSVRELFQRGVDQKRVDNEINEYFKSKTQQKFFNPLTIVMLPMKNNQVGNGVVEKGNLESDLMKEGDYKIIEAEDYYKFRVHSHQAYSELHLTNPSHDKPQSAAHIISFLSRTFQKVRV